MYFVFRPSFLRHWPPFVAALMKKNPEKVIGFDREGNIKSGNIIKVKERLRPGKGAYFVHFFTGGN